MNTESIFNSKTVFLDPLRIKKPLSWVTHIPFAFFLVEQLKPKTIVELGVHSGNSFLAFCQAVDFTHLHCHCFGIDTWKGDDHAGFYPESVYLDLHSFHDQYFKNFSKLIRKSFDDALSDFPNDYIDILHIDGLHTYEAVRHDFESWFPKINKSSGIILFHDTQVVDKGFGVHKFWQEVCQRHRHFEFKHGNGLGILFIGENLSSNSFHNLFKETKYTPFLEQFFYKLGQKIAIEYLLKFEYAQEKEFFSQLFLACNEGFLENASEKFYFERINVGNKIITFYPNKQYLHKVRFDPLNSFVELTLNHITINGKYYQPFKLIDKKQSNFYVTDENTFLFMSFDPQLIINLPEEVTLKSIDTIEFGVYLHKFDLEAADALHKHLYSQIEHYQLKIKDLTKLAQEKDSILIQKQQLLLSNHKIISDLTEHLKNIHNQQNKTIELESKIIELENKIHEIKMMLSESILYKAFSLKHIKLFLRYRTSLMLSFFKGLPIKLFTYKRYFISNFGRPLFLRLEDLNIISRNRIATLQNGFWLGSRYINYQKQPINKFFSVIGRVINQLDTDYILKNYYNDYSNIKLFDIRPLLPLKELELLYTSHSLLQESPAGGTNIEKMPSFSIITPFYKHKDFFVECAKSVERNIISLNNLPIEWIIVNDDPNISCTDLLSFIPAVLKVRTKIINGGNNQGISTRLNQGIDHTTFDWIVFLDCDDCLTDNAISTVIRYIRQYPQYRYISSNMIDIDEKGEVLRYRIRAFGPSKLFELGMTAGHLKIVHKSLFKHYGSYDLGFDGCQDYEFTLRIFFEEPIMYIPEYIYKYRWHNNSQSVNSFLKQHKTTNIVLQRSVLNYFESLEKSWEPYLTNPDNKADISGGLAVIRTQGRRNDLLVETLQSIWNQTYSLSALVIVHSSEQDFRNVQEFLEPFGRNIVVIHASDTNKKRGYPLNIAIDKIKELQLSASYVCFLDDDDIIYPMFSYCMVSTMRATGVDVVYSKGNKIIPWQNTKHGHNIFPISCLLLENFITINSFCVNYNKLLSSNIRFREDMHYLEDWHFLLELLDRDFYFYPTAQIVSEYRVFSDGNAEFKKDMSEYNRCLSIINSLSNRILRKKGKSWAYFNLLNFPIELFEKIDNNDLLFRTRRHISSFDYREN